MNAKLGVDPSSPVEEVNLEKPIEKEEEQGDDDEEEL
jgi:hypothetical protein